MVLGHAVRACTIFCQPKGQAQGCEREHVPFAGKLGRPNSTKRERVPVKLFQIKLLATDRNDTILYNLFDEAKLRSFFSHSVIGATLCRGKSRHNVRWGPVYGNGRCSGEDVRYVFGYGQQHEIIQVFAI